MDRSDQPSHPSRRAVLARASAAAGCLTLGFAPISSADAQEARTASVTAPAVAPPPQAPSEVTAWIVIAPNDTVTIRIARSEMGQGALTALAMLIAEELDCEWSKVRAEYAPPGENLRRKARIKASADEGRPLLPEMAYHWGNMSTGGSRGTRESERYLREVGAMARNMLIEAAAKEWNVSAFDCTAGAGVIAHAASGRKTTYGRVAAAAARLAPPTRVTLKDPKTWKLAGKPLRQINVAQKVNGSLTYAIDVRLPEMLHATVAQCPVFGGKLRSFEEARARTLPGVRQAVKLDDGTLCVIADSFWQAKRAVDQIKVIWDEGAAAKVTATGITELIKSGLTAQEAGVSQKIGDAAGLLAQAQRKVEAEYATPFLSHATLEPMNCVARFADNKVEIWVGTQNGEAALMAAAEAGGVKPENVTVNKMHLGGGYGRRGNYHDFVRFAVLAARRVPGRPVKLVMSREEDMTHGFYRPASAARMSAALDDKGMPAALQVRLAGPSILGQHAPDRVKDGVDPQQVISFQMDDLGYGFPNLLVEVAIRPTHVPVGVWRSVYASQNTFYKECFIDEMASAAAKDPLDYRRALLGAAQKVRRVLDVAADKAGWGKPPPAGQFRGIAVETLRGSVQATVAEVSVTDGALRVHRIVNAVDCGHAVNPGIIDQQLSGAAAMALTAVMWGEMKIDRGRMVETNFDSYPVLRLADMPQVENHIVPSFDGWGGIGEVGVPTIAPAVCNAIFAATQIRVRSLPLKHHKLVKA